MKTFKKNKNVFDFKKLHSNQRKIYLISKNEKDQIKGCTKK